MHHSVLPGKQNYLMGRDMLTHRMWGCSWPALRSLRVSNSLGASARSLSGEYHGLALEAVRYQVWQDRQTSCAYCRCNNVLYLRGVPEEDEEMT